MNIPIVPVPKPRRTNGTFLPKHGRRYTVEYRIWQDMLNRCRNVRKSNYQYYGARGIKVCERWHEFENFYADMGERPSDEYSLDRIDNDSDYEPNNCRWATRSEQRRNKRNTSYIEIGGERLSVADVAERFGLKRDTLLKRVKKGMRGIDAITYTPRT